MGGGTNVESRRMLLFSQWQCPLGTTFVWTLTKNLPLGIDPPWTWQSWVFSSQLEVIMIRAAQWPPGPALSLTHTSSPVVCSGRYRYHCSKAVSFWVVQLWWKGGLIQRQGQPCAQVHLLFYQVTVTKELTMLLRCIPFFVACAISHKILSLHSQTSPS